MVSEKHGKRYTPRFKFQVVMEILSGTKAIGQIARSYGVHPVTLTHWKKEFIEKGPEIFSQQTTIQEYEVLLVKSSVLFRKIFFKLDCILCCRYVT